MNRLAITESAALFLAVASAWLILASNCIAVDQPNILLIMADDVGVEAFSSYHGSPTNTSGGGTIDTPHLDALAKHGVQYNNAISCPLCTPSRVALMTGKYNYRNYRSFGYLDNNQTTFAEVLRDNGYTTAIAGKWQLSKPDIPLRVSGATAPIVTPAIMRDDYGFDTYLLWQLNHTNADKGSRYWRPKVETASSDGRSSEVISTTIEDFGPDMFTRFLNRFISDAVRDKKPFLAYYSMVLPHNPWVPTPAQSPTDAQKNIASKANFDENIEHIDHVVGELVGKLDSLGVRKNTLVIFTSDNGTSPRITIRTDEGPIRGDKGTATYYGTHVPFIVSWLGVVDYEEGGSNRMVDFTDIFPTLLAVTDITTPDGLRLDGKPILSASGDPLENKEAAYMWYDPKKGQDFPRDYPKAAFAQEQRYKLYADGRLYDIHSDPRERHDLSGSMPSRARRAYTTLKRVLDQRRYH